MAELIRDTARAALQLAAASRPDEVVLCVAHGCVLGRWLLAALGIAPHGDTTFTTARINALKLLLAEAASQPATQAAAREIFAFISSSACTMANHHRLLVGVSSDGVQGRVIALG